MTGTTPTTKIRSAKIRQPSVATRRVGYVIGVVLNLAVLYAVNIWPGWQAAPILTAETVSVLVIVNVSIASNIAANALYLVNDAPWLKSLGSVVTTTIGMIAMVRIWQEFPFDFNGSSVKLGTPGAHCPGRRRRWQCHRNRRCLHQLCEERRDSLLKSRPSAWKPLGSLVNGLSPGQRAKDRCSATYREADRTH